MTSTSEISNEQDREVQDFTEQAQRLVGDIKREAWDIAHRYVEGEDDVGRRRRCVEAIEDLCDQVRSKAATSALEQAAQVIRERRKWYDEELFGPMPSTENATDNEKRLVTLASANMARHTCDHLLTEIAAIGDDRE